MASFDVSPPVHRISTPAEFDRSVFHRSIPVLATKILAAKTNQIARKDPVRRFILDLPRLRSVLPDPAGDAQKRLVLLRASSKEELPPDIVEYLEREAEGFVDHQIELDYSYWTAGEILDATLPEELNDTSPSSFTITGHLAHFNLRDEYLPYKNIIGQIVLDKHKSLRTVVNKLDNIDNEFRFFKMEVLAGESDFIVETSESNCRFKFDFSQVYWNSRLHSEHERLVGRFKPTDVIADVFGGVGPFVVPAAKKGCAVFGNDLNPNSAKYMQLNVDDNRVDSRVVVSCQDGREFIKQVAYESWHKPFPELVGLVKTARQLEREDRRRRNQAAVSVKVSPPEPPLSSPPVRRRIDHFVMNLPGSALEFLDAYRGCLASVKDEGEFEQVYDVMPMVHCHCFTRELERDKAEQDIRNRAEAALGQALEGDVEYHFVRSVAPNKDMYCLSFRLSKSLVV